MRVLVVQSWGGDVLLLVADRVVAGITLSGRGGMREMVLSFRGRQHAAGHASPVAAARTPRALRGIIIAGIAAIFLTVIGAVGTNEVTLLRRLAYWFVLMESGALLGILVSTTIQLWGGLRLRPWLEGIGITIVITLPLTTVVITADHLFFGRGFPSVPQMFVEGLVVTMFSGLMTAINCATAPNSPAEVVDRGYREPSAVPSRDNTDAAIEVQARFFERLPMHLRQARLLAIEAEDHYLRIHTDAGSSLILLRLSDAIGELETLPGARTHRSWWVARDAVAFADINKSRASFTLSNGLSVPVSRSFKPQLRADGWFE